MGLFGRIGNALSGGEKTGAVSSVSKRCKVTPQIYRLLIIAKLKGDCFNEMDCIFKERFLCISRLDSLEVGEKERKSAEIRALLRMGNIDQKKIEEVQKSERGLPERKGLEERIVGLTSSSEKKQLEWTRLGSLFKSEQRDVTHMLNEELRIGDGSGALKYADFLCMSEEELLGYVSSVPSYETTKNVNEIRAEIK